MKPDKKTPKEAEFVAARFVSYPNLEAAERESETGAPLPADDQVNLAKRWVEENEL